MPIAKKPFPLARPLLLALFVAAGAAGCRSSARDDYMAARNIRIAPTEAGDESSGVAGVNSEGHDPSAR